MDGWRILLVIGALGALFVIVMRRGLPESPRWLARMGRTEEAQAAVRAFESGSAARVAPVDDADTDDDHDANPIEAARP